MPPITMALTQRPTLRLGTLRRLERSAVRPVRLCAKKRGDQGAAGAAPELPEDSQQVLRQYFEERVQRAAPPAAAGLSAGAEGLSAGAEGQCSPEQEAGVPGQADAPGTPNSMLSAGGAGGQGGEEVKVELSSRPLPQGSGQPPAESLSPSEPLKAPEPAPKDMAEAAKQVFEATGKLADTARQAAEQVASTAKAQGELVDSQLQATQQEVLYTTEQLAQGLQSDLGDVAAAVEQAAGDVQSDLSSAAEGLADTATEAVAEAAEEALSNPPPSGASPAAAASEQQALGAAAAAATAASPAAVMAAGPGGADAQQAAAAPPAGGHQQNHHSSSAKGDVDKIKLRLVEVLASLDRGVAATKEQLDLVDGLCRELEDAAGPVLLSWDKIDGKPAGLGLLEGRWRLLYSSGFSTGRLGGMRPGPSVTLSPFTLGQVYQDIRVGAKQLDNVVDLILKYSLAGLPGISADTPVATATLKHSMEIIGHSTVEISFDATSVKLKGGLRSWLDDTPTFNIPGLQDILGSAYPKKARSARFEVAYLDGDLRVTRGDRGELRVFVKGGL